MITSEYLNNEKSIRQFRIVGIDIQKLDTRYYDGIANKCKPTKEFIKNGLGIPWTPKKDDAI